MLKYINYAMRMRSMAVEAAAITEGDVFQEVIRKVLFEVQLYNQRAEEPRYRYREFKHLVAVCRNQVRYLLIDIARKHRVHFKDSAPLPLDDV